ncbi:CAP domain-containing protein [Sphingomonas aliaeris]|uniref:CAP domain-containing protein n=1 Tax=Sphingomonas aliaeris TaxID=2759526 RepID=A0A974S341_9SPHN|nr:CAP domain-containing protein [Sphingomonas aliaeris]QQV76108.1 CAP domain-containing protein [Sphingomonas aliaeris]
MRALRLAVLAPIIALLPASAPGYPSAAEILGEINRLRTNPVGYARSLEDYRRLFDPRDQRLYTMPGETLPRLSIDGAAAVDEAITALRRQSPRIPLDVDSTLTRTARLLADDQAITGAIGHRTAQAPTPGDRSKAASGDIYLTEAVSYGFTSPEDVVRQLVIDDGVPGRGHRRTLFSPELRFAGVWCGPHARRAAMCAIDLSAWRGGRPTAE